ncbi:hypothetical protein FQZ97_1152210 [compost metagenome]
MVYRTGQSDPGVIIQILIHPCLSVQGRAPFIGFGGTSGFQRSLVAAADQTVRKPDQPD